MNKKLGELYLTFVKIGLITFGGGLTMLAILENEIVDHKGWATKEELVDYMAVSRCTPGVVAINLATFVGCRLCGTLGGFVSTAGFITAPLLIIVILARAIFLYASSPVVVSALRGLKAGMGALIFTSIISLLKPSIKDIYSFIVALIAFFVVRFTDVPIVFVIIFGIVAGLLKRRTS